MTAMFDLIALVVALICIAACYQLAKKKGRRPWLWAVLGFVAGIVALIVLALLPNLREKETEVEIARALPTARLDRLAALGELHDKGALSDGEFAVEKDWVMRHDQPEWGPPPGELARIVALHDAGTLTDEEYEHERERVLVHH
jgi:hypothetical protein